MLKVIRILKKYVLLLHQLLFFHFHLNVLIILNLLHYSHLDLYYMGQYKNLDHQHLYIIYHLFLMLYILKNSLHNHHGMFRCMSHLVLPMFLIYMFHLLVQHIFPLYLYIHNSCLDELYCILQVFFHILQQIFHNLPLLYYKHLILHYIPHHTLLALLHNLIDFYLVHQNIYYLL